ncbi:MAG: hypothetical protein J6N21_05205 [Butyrivibrio sp.]|nr:hypothetical protein [Butyrivibrio sp.]
MAAAFAVVLRDKIENYICASIIVTTIVAYFFAVVGIIKVGLWITIIISLFSLGLVAYSFVSQKDVVTKYIFTPGLLVFAVISFGLFIFNINVDAAGSPDSLYWVSIAKNYCFFDEFNRQSHPQFIAIWGYLSMKTWFGWSDMVLVATNNIFKISLLLPLFTCLKSSDRVKYDRKQLFYSNFILALIIAFFPYISESDEYAIYSTDLIMGILFGMGIVLFVRAFTEKKQSLFFVALVYLSAATVIKRIAIIILAMLMVWILYVLIEKREKKLIVLYMIVPALVYYMGAGSIKYAVALIGSLIAAWTLGFLVQRRSIVLYVVAGTSLIVAAGAVVWFVLKMSAERYAEIDMIEVAKVFVKMLFTANEEFYYVGELVHLSLVAFLLVIVGVFVVVFLRNRNSSQNCEVFLFCGLMVTTVLYLIMMCFLYMTEIAYANSLMFRESLLGLQRYMKIIPAMLGCYLLFFIISKYKDYRILLVLFLCITLFCNLKNLSEFVFVNEDKVTFPEMELAGIELTEEDNIAYIDMGIRDYFQSFILYCFPYTVTNVDELSYTYRDANDMKYISEAELAGVI